MHFGLAYLLLLGLAIGWAMLVVYTAWLLTHPPKRGYAFAVSRGLPGDPGECLGRDAQWSAWAFRSPRGIDLPVWEITGQNPSGAVIIVTHGWGDSRVVMLSRLPTLVRSASRVLLWDLPGHGDAPGTCALGSRESDDLLALIEQTNDREIVLYGFSLGAGVSLVAAARLGERVRAVIAEAPYRLPHTPARNMLELRGLPYGATLRPALAIVGLANAGTIAWARRGDAGGFDRALHAARLHQATRLLILHGELDAICPIDDSRAIAAAGRGEVQIIPGGSHAQLWTDPQALEHARAAFEQFLRGRAEPPSA